MLRIEIDDFDNAAMRTAPLAEAVRITRKILDSIDLENPSNGFGRKLLDENGNTVGYISWLDPIYASEETE